MPADIPASVMASSLNYRKDLMQRRHFTVGVVALVGYIATIVIANWALHHVGTPPPPGSPSTVPHTLFVWPGIAAPSAVYFIGLALVLRNVVQRQLGRVVAISAILVGAGISWWVADPTLAKASALAFLCSEALDMLIYTPLRKWLENRGHTATQVAGAVLPASLAGALLDSYVFLHFAFHSESFFKAQMIGKTWGILGATLVLAAMPTVAARLPRTPEVIPA